MNTNGHEFQRSKFKDRNFAREARFSSAVALRGGWLAKMGVRQPGAAFILANSTLMQSVRIKQLIMSMAKVVNFAKTLRHLMPVWTGKDDAVARTNISRALSKGLTFRPLDVTARDTLAWFKSLPPDRQAHPKAGLSAEREAEVLAQWHKQQRG